MKMVRLRYLLLILLAIGTVKIAAKDIEVEELNYTNLLRISILKITSSHTAPVNAYVSSPISGEISTMGETGGDVQSSIVGVPKMLIGNNLVMLVFDFKTPLPGGTSAFTLHVTNGLGYDKYITCGPIYHFQDAVPLNPNGDTVIGIFVTDKF